MPGKNEPDRYSRSLARTRLIRRICKRTPWTLVQWTFRPRDLNSEIYLTSRTVAPANSKNKDGTIRHEADGVFPADDLDREQSLHLTPLTGRETEVSLLTNRWELANEGMGQVVLLIGEAGLGKSRMVRTLKEIVLSEAVDDAAGSETQPA